MMKPVSTRTMNLAHIVEQQARRLGDKPAFVWGDTSWDWKALDQRVKAMAAVFASYGIGHGDRVLVQSRNCNQLFESMFACFRLGAVWVPSNFRGTPDDLAWMLELSSAKLLLCEAPFADHATIMDQDKTIAIGKADFAPDIDELMAEITQEPALAVVDRDDPCWFFFTSGTSGRPKASVLTHGQLGFVINNHLCDLVPGCTYHDASLVVAPLSHGAGVHQLMMASRGAPSILTNAGKFDTAEIWSLVEKWRVTNIFTVPTILKLLVEAPEVTDHDHSSLRYVIYAGAPMYRKDQIKALNVLGPVLVQYFGLGEVTGNITVLPPYEHSSDEDMRVGSCGFARTGMHVDVLNDKGEPCAPGETGEICVTGPAVFSGYWQNPEANAKSFRNGMFRTGDLGHMDEDGFFYITGRQSDMYISGGSNIYPREIEEKLLQHPALSEVAIFGMPDEKWGEIGVAVVAPHEGMDLSAEAVQEFLKDKIASYKMPKMFHVWDEIPKSGYGKMAKRLVRAELERRMEAGDL